MAFTLCERDLQGAVDEVLHILSPAVVDAAVLREGSQPLGQTLR